MQRAGKGPLRPDFCSPSSSSSSSQAPGACSEALPEHAASQAAPLRAAQQCCGAAGAAKRSGECRLVPRGCCSTGCLLACTSPSPAPVAAGHPLECPLSGGDLSQINLFLLWGTPWKKKGAEASFLSAQRKAGLQAGC